MALSEQLQQQSMDQFRKHATAAHQEKTGTPWLIRDDGVVFPNTPLLFKKKNMRPYHGDPGASKEERERYLAGHQRGRRAVVVEEELPPLNIRTATKEELIAFAMEQHSEVIPPEEHINKVRALICRLEGLDYNEVFGGGSKATGLAKEPATAGA
jgi:hypothetical protein